MMSSSTFALDFFVSQSGNDANAGTQDSPFATLFRAQLAARLAKKDGPVTIWVHEGIYYLPQTLVFTAADSGTAQTPIIYQSVNGEKAVLSGGRRLKVKWEAYRDGIVKAKVPEGTVTDQLFVNGRRQILARYPNCDPNVRIFDGYAADALSPERVARWSAPRGGFIHALQSSLWGSLEYVITGKDALGNLTYKGGWQNNRPTDMHRLYRFVENIFEELDAPGEWFLDAKTSTLYFYPPAGLDLPNAIIETASLKQLVEFNGSETAPVKFITLRGFAFHNTVRTFMDTREPLLRSDWRIYRGGAIFFNGAENCTVADCDFDQLGGNTIFVNNYNRHLTIRDCLIQDSGASGICFVGDPNSVRMPRFTYEHYPRYDQIDQAPGPKSFNYPMDCLVDDCLIARTGRFEKQSAGVEMAMARNITVRHCSIYDVPRAGINIGDGCWGGDVIEFCDVFDTVLETGDHGSFNSWGRDRYWNLNDVPAGKLSGLARLDVIEPNIIRNSRWRCDHGWDIDLDDGSSNYEIKNNLCLHGGIKLREGFYRVCENNVIVNNSLHSHVWYPGSQDVFRRNIIFTDYRPIQMQQPWGRECDFNLLHRSYLTNSVPAVTLQQQSGADTHSFQADARFVNATKGDFRVKAGSPALKLGFQNFPMDQFGVTSSRLKSLARTPVVPAIVAPPAVDPSAVRVAKVVWRGAVIANLKGEEYSVLGVSRDATGVLLEEVPGYSGAAKDGLQTGDFIESINARPISGVADFLSVVNASEGSADWRFGLVRGHKEIMITVNGVGHTN